MARTYTDTPEPRYVEKAKESETTSMLPEIKNADRGKFLKVKANKNELMYDNIPNEVPEPTIADSGKVVKVNSSGAYELGTAGGGNTPLIVTCTYDGTDTYTLNKNYTEITTAINSGQNVYISYNSYKCLIDNTFADTDVYVVSSISFTIVVAHLQPNEQRAIFYSDSATGELVFAVIN